jgi:hypothetical protein
VEVLSTIALSDARAAKSDSALLVAVIRSSRKGIFPANSENTLDLLNFPFLFDPAVLEVAVEVAAAVAAPSE